MPAWQLPTETLLKTLHPDPTDRDHRYPITFDLAVRLIGLSKYAEPPYQDQDQLEVLKGYD